MTHNSVNPEARRKKDLREISISIKLTRQEHKILENFAKQLDYGVTIAGVIRQAIKEKVSKIQFSQIKSEIKDKE